MKVKGEPANGDIALDKRQRVFAAICMGMADADAAGDAA